jgi:hypothetical protein
MKKNIEKEKISYSIFTRIGYLLSGGAINAPCILLVLNMQKMPFMSYPGMRRIRKVSNEYCVVEMSCISIANSELMVLIDGTIL